MTFNNTCFSEPGEIEPIDLIEYIIKALHIENNKIMNNKIRLYSKDNDPSIFIKEESFNKFLLTFKSIFKSFISDLFFGGFEITKLCYTCKKQRFYFENFFYLILDINQSMKCGNNPKDINFIIQSINKEFTNNINISRYCPFCKSQQKHYENKKIISLPKNLIIYFKNEGQTSINYPINIDFSTLKLGNNEIYNLNAIIKKSSKNEEIVFECLYPENNNWTLSNGYFSQYYSSPFEHSDGNVIMLFYGCN